jgi:hypothetical protein
MEPGSLDLVVRCGKRGMAGKQGLNVVRILCQNTIGYEAKCNPSCESSIQQLTLRPTRTQDCDLPELQSLVDVAELPEKTAGYNICLNMSLVLVHRMSSFIHASPRFSAVSPFR